MYLAKEKQYLFRKGIFDTKQAQDCGIYSNKMNKVDCIPI